MELNFIKALITLFTFTYLQLDQERQVGDFSVVPTRSSMTFFIGLREPKWKIEKNRINLVEMCLAFKSFKMTRVGFKG